MADGDVFDKLDALIHKGLGNAPAPDAPHPGTLPEGALDTSPIPVLTDVVAEPEPAVPPPAEEPDLPPVDELVLSLAPVEESASPVLPPEEMEALAQTLERRLTPRLTAALDNALGEMLEPFREEAGRLVREALEEEIRKKLRSLPDRP